MKRALMAFNEAFIDYARECSRCARALMPHAPTMICTLRHQ